MKRRKLCKGPVAGKSSRSSEKRAQCVDDKGTAIADEIRELSGASGL